MQYTSLYQVSSLDEPKVNLPCSIPLVAKPMFLPCGIVDVRCRVLC